MFLKRVLKNLTGPEPALIVSLATKCVLTFDIGGGEAGNHAVMRGLEPRDIAKFERCARVR